MLKRIDSYLAAVDNRSLLAIIIGLTSVLGILDYYSGSELSISFVYTVPIMLAVWYGGHQYGWMVSIASTFIWTASELATGRGYSHPLIIVWNALIILAFFVLIMRLLLLLKDKIATLNNFASIDGLTGLINRRIFLEQLEHELARVRRYPEIFTLAYIDLDNFKYVNDSLGHMVGDELLQTIGRTISDNLRESDLGARLGGDEFMVYFPTMDEKSAVTVMEELQKKLIHAMDEKSWPVTFSIGMVTYKQPMKNVREMVHKVDELMYRVKKTGKNNISHAVWPVVGVVGGKRVGL